MVSDEGSLTTLGGKSLLAAVSSRPRDGNRSVVATLPFVSKGTSLVCRSIESRRLAAALPGPKRQHCFTRFVGGSNELARAREQSRFSDRQPCPGASALPLDGAAVLV